MYSFDEKSVRRISNAVRRVEKIPPHRSGYKNSSASSSDVMAAKIKSVENDYLIVNPINDSGKDIKVAKPYKLRSVEASPSYEVDDVIFVLWVGLTEVEVSSEPLRWVDINVDGRAEASFIIFPVSLSQNGGNGGSATTTCSYTYDVTDDRDGTEIATDLTPVAAPRPSNVKMIAGTQGIAYYDDNGDVVLYSVIDEVPDYTDECEE